ncbi:MAG: Ni/Fe hydrogenase subunit alpha, partial [Cyanobacteria bacterium P01_H01_bin.105]
KIVSTVMSVKMLTIDKQLISAREGETVLDAARNANITIPNYKIDETGLLTRVNLIIATGQNNLAMNRAVAQIARHYIHGPEISESVLNRMEAGIRAFDPCLSCSIHAVGKMPLHLQLVGADGQLLDECYR